MEFSHKPVLLRETIEALRIDPCGVYVDGTAGGGGHSEQIANRLTSGRLVCIDQDPDAIEAVTQRLGGRPNVKIVRANYSEIKSILAAAGISAVNGVLLDIGVSSHQLDTAERGFSYHADAPLDMRMSREGETAAELVNQRSAEELAKIFFEYGEEKFSRRIAERIVREREEEPILTTLRLAEIISAAVPAASRRDGHPARRVFQALRIAVNHELDRLSDGLEAAFDVLAPGGVLAVITFHSLEDRIVKQRFAGFCKGCVCPPDFPVCICGRTPRGKLVTRRAVESSPEELSENPRCRSAKLRAVQKI